MSTPRRILGTFVTLLAAGAGCTQGTETDNPGDLVRFEDSGCKSESDALASPGESQSSLASASAYDGLNCVEWERQTDDVLTLRLLNFRGGCSVTWRGHAAHANDGALELVLENARCAVAACGSCLYDWRFDVKKVDATAGLPLRIGFRDCAGEDVHWDYETALPEDAGDSGVVCRYANRFALEDMLSAQGRCGERLAPCGTPGSACGQDNAPACHADFTCAETSGPEDMRCLEPCSEAADCSPAGVNECVDGLCKVSGGW